MGDPLSFMEEKNSEKPSENTKSTETTQNSLENSVNISESPRRNGKIRMQPTWLTYEHGDYDENIEPHAVMIIATEIAPQSAKAAFSGPEFDL